MSSEAVNIIINMYLDVEMSSANTDFIVINTCLYEEMSIENVVSTVVYNKINIHERITDDAFNQISLNHTRTICKGYIESVLFLISWGKAFSTKLHMGRARQTSLCI